MRNACSEREGPKGDNRTFMGRTQQHHICNPIQRSSIMSTKSAKRKIGSIGGIKAFSRNQDNSQQEINTGENAVEERSIRFFPEPHTNDNEGGYEVRIDNYSHDPRSDFLQFMHL